jgi:hypothetical protein
MITRSAALRLDDRWRLPGFGRQQQRAISIIAMGGEISRVPARSGQKKARLGEPGRALGTIPAY